MPRRTSGDGSTRGGSVAVSAPTPEQRSPDRQRGDDEQRCESGNRFHPAVGLTRGTLPGRVVSQTRIPRRFVGSRRPRLRRRRRGHACRRSRTRGTWPGWWCSLEICGGLRTLRRGETQPRRLPRRCPARVDPLWAPGRLEGTIQATGKPADRRTPRDRLTGRRLRGHRGAEQDLEDTSRSWLLPDAARDPRLGDGAIAVTQVQGSGSFAQRYFTVAWRQAEPLLRLGCRGSTGSSPSRTWWHSRESRTARLRRRSFCRKRGQAFYIVLPLCSDRRGGAVRRLSVRSCLRARS